jgi:hypothetical protein
VVCRAHALSPVFFAAPGTPWFGPPAPGRTEGAWDVRLPTDPRTSTPSDIEAWRSSNFRKFAASIASRARSLRFAPSRPRWTSHFRRPASPLELEGRLSTAVDLNDAQHFRPCGCRSQWGPATHGWRAGTKRLGPPGSNSASSLPPYSPATAPRPASGDAAPTPLGHEGREFQNIILIRNIVEMIEERVSIFQLDIRQVFFRQTVVNPPPRGGRQRRRHCL